MEKSNYKLFFYLGEKPININLKHVLNPQTNQQNETRAKLFNQDIQKNIYTKAKQNYEFLMKKNNKNIYMLNKKGGKFPSKEYLEALENIDKKIKKENFSLLPFPPHKKENNKSVEELRRMQRNKVTMRRIEYSMKVKHTANKKRNKYNIKKVITIQKWVRGFLLRNLISNLSYFEDFTNEFMEHIKKFVFLKHKIIMNKIIKYMQYKLKKNSINEIKNNNSIKNACNNNSNKKDKNLDIIKENHNERYIDEDSIMEYNNRYNKNSKDFTNKNRREINKINDNFLFFSSKDFSDKINLNQKSNNYNNDSNSNILLNSSNNSGNNNVNINNNKNNNNLFKLSESSISPEKNKENNLNNNNNKLIEDTLNSNKEYNFNTLKNEEARDLFNAKHSNDLVEPSPAMIKNIITNNVKTEENKDIIFNNINFNNQLLIRRPKLNRKFIEEINNTHSSATPTKYNNFLNNDEDINNKKNNNIKNKNNKNERDKKEEKNKNGKNSNPIKLNNQAGSISNPTNSTLDSNTLNINRKMFLDENFNININKNQKPQADKEIDKEIKIKIIKPIILPCNITKIIIDKRKIKVDIKNSKSEKKFVPKKFDIEYHYSEENQNLNISIKKNDEQNCDDTLKNIINIQNDSNNFINYEINKNDSSDMNINVLKVVNNNVDELNNSIKNILKEELPSPSPDTNQNNQNIFSKSLRELLKLDQQKTNNNIIINNIEEENSFNNSSDININNDCTQNKEIEESNNKLSIEAIKEVKEEYEEEKENEAELSQKKIIGFNISNNSEILEMENNNTHNDKNQELIRFDKNIFFSIIPGKRNVQSEQKSGRRFPEKRKGVYRL